jgi:monoamine oxidase
VWFKVRGGNDLIPRGFAASLARNIIYSSPVVRVEQDARGVRAIFIEKGSRQSVAGDYLVCAVPFSVINRIEFAPALSDKKRALIDKAGYISITRTFLQVRERYWLRQAVNGFAVTDDPMEIWHSTFDSPGKRGILVSYARYDYSKRITAMEEGERVNHMVSQVEKLFPGINDHFESGLTKCWDEDEWARGAWTEMNWGQTYKIAKPDGRLYLAGDHFSTATSWMQGALESGTRVAKEINDAR